MADIHQLNKNVYRQSIEPSIWLRLLADQLESAFGEVAGSHPTARTFIVLSRGAATKTRNVKSERGEISSKVLEVY